MKAFAFLILSVAACYGQTAAADSPLNRGLPSWLQFSADYRSRLEGFGGGGFQSDSEDAYLLSRLRLNLQIEPLSWLRFFAQAQDARVFWKNQSPAAPPFQDTMDLRQGYVQLGDTEKGPVALRVGRQELNFGDQRLVGSSNWTNVARTFDAARATFRYKGYRLDAFSSSVVVPQDGAFDHHLEGSNLHGLYGGLEKLVPQAVIEPYVFWRVAPRQLTESGTLAHLSQKTAGIRWVGKLPAGFDYATEMALQRGSIGPDAIQAWAGHWVVGYTIDRTRLFAEFNYASGDHNAHDGTRGTFDQLYPTAHDKYGMTDQVGWRNIEDVRLGLEWKPAKRWVVIPAAHSWWLADPHDGLYNASSIQIARAPAGNAGTHVGEEIECQAVYTLNKHFQAGFGAGHLFPGEFLRRTTPGKAYTFPFLMAGYSF